MKVQKEGFQNRAGEALLEKGGSASVRYWYTRTVLSKFASDAMSNTLCQHTHRYQSPLFELPYMYMPPSMWIVWPVIYDASFEAKNRTALEISSTLPSLASGI